MFAFATRKGMGNVWVAKREYQVDQADNWWTLF